VAHPTRGERLRYRFDNFMARGTTALLFGLFVASLLVIVLLAVYQLVVNGAELADTQHLDPLQLLYFNLLRTLDPGTFGGDQGSPAFLAGALAVTLGSRVAGFVTQVPRRRCCVLTAMRVSRG